MEWLVIAGLGVVVWLQWRRIDELTRRLEKLEGDRADTPAAATTPRAPAPAPQATDEREPLLLNTPLPPDDREPLLLDTPLPPASNDDEPLVDFDAPLPPIPAAAYPRPRARAALASTFETWLSENGFAWLGGGLLALGGALLVAFVSQQDFFTPPVRLWSAAALGLALIGAGAWVRGRPQSHRLVAALLTGAGAATLYAAAWAAHGLYDLISWSTAAALLALVAAALLGLAFLHGEALGALAIAAALLAPVLASLGAWPPAAIALYATIVAASGFAIAALRRWAWVAGVTLAGLYAWFAGAIADDEIGRALLFVSVASLGAGAIGIREARPDEREGAYNWSSVRASLPTIAICFSSVLLLWPWLALAPAINVSIAGTALIGVFHVVLAALAVRARIAQPPAFLVAASMLALGAAAYMQSRFMFAPLGADFHIWLWAAAPAIVLAALGARPDRHGRALVSGAGAISAAVLLVLAAVTQGGALAWAPLFVGALAFGFAAVRVGADARDPAVDASVDFWAGAGAALVLIGLELALGPWWLPAAEAAAALLFAALHAWRGWRAARGAALIAAAIAIAHAVSPEVTGLAMADASRLTQTLVTFAAAAALFFAAARIIAARARASAEALTSAAIITIVTAAFVGLRWLAAGDTYVPIDAFTEVSLRGLMLMVAGYLALPRRGQDAGFIGRWRGHALMAAGVIYALPASGYALNPWWGLSPAIIAGPPLLNAQALAFAAPAALGLLAARRFYAEQKHFARPHAIGGALFAALWIVLEIRRAFHGAESARAPIGLLEGDCYGLAALVGALVIALVARQRAAKTADGPFTQDLLGAAGKVAAAAAIVGVLFLVILRHPWWGAHDASVTNSLDTGLATLAQALGAGLALALGRALSRAMGVDPVRFIAASTAALLAWSFGHAAIRWFYHHGAMDGGAALVGLEGLAHALWPLAFVLAGSALTERAPGRDTFRAYLHDLEAIWAAAVWPALAFAALGLWLLYTPWWGIAPARAGSAFAALAGLAAFIAAAWMSLAARNVPHLRWPAIFAPAALTACVFHLFVAATLVVRQLYRGADMGPAPAEANLETWTYSAVWAVFGAGVVGMHFMRRNSVLFWCGVAVLTATTAKVFLFDMARLDGLVRAGSFLALGAIVVLLALAARRAARPESGVTADGPPSPRRDKRHGRRYTRD